MFPAQELPPGSDGAAECSSLNSSCTVGFRHGCVCSCRRRSVPFQTSPPTFALKVSPPLPRLSSSALSASIGLSAGWFPWDNNSFLGRTWSHPGTLVLAGGTLWSLTSRGIPSPAGKGRVLHYSLEFREMIRKEAVFRGLSWFLSVHTIQ